MNARDEPLEIISEAEWNGLRPGATDQGAAEAHSRSDQLDDVDGANIREAGSPDGPEKTHDTEGQQDEEDAEQPSVISHLIPLF